MSKIRNLVIAASEFSSRRSMLAENIIRQFEGKNHIIVLSSSDVQYKTRHIPRPYHQDPYFYYYTGFMKKKAVLLMNVIRGQVSSSLYIDRPSREETLWNGPYPSKEDALTISGVDTIGYGDDWRQQLEQIVKHEKISFLWSDNTSNFAVKVASVVKDLERRDISVIADRQRVIKSTAEVEIMRESSKITARALKLTMSHSRVGISEHELLGKLSYELSVSGGKLAYPPVIAGGERANIIHYLEGECIVNDGELVLIDVGADVLGYYSDVTRTWPINGRFSSAQALLYDVLVSVHSDCVKACTQESSLDGMLTFMYKRMAHYLVKEGVVEDAKNIYSICPHHVGHYLGLDIHDTPTISTAVPLAPGMVFPLEPGLYFQKNCKFVDPIFRGIGMRLEDDFLMTESGTVECLTTDLPRSRTDIEKMCKSGE